jgi:hypothetical protein
MIFERTGIAIDERDPIMAVLVASAHQSEEIGSRLLARTSPVRVVVVTAAAGLVFALAGAVGAWYVAQGNVEDARARWVRAQSDPRLASILSSDEGRAAIRLADLGVARLLEQCAGRRSWRVHDGYCVPMTPDGRPDGFRVKASD